MSVQKVKIKIWPDPWRSGRRLAGFMQLLNGNSLFTHIKSHNNYCSICTWIFNLFLYISSQFGFKFLQGSKMTFYFQDIIGNKSQNCKHYFRLFAKGLNLLSYFTKKLCAVEWKQRRNIRPTILNQYENHSNPFKLRRVLIKVWPMGK